MSIPESLPPGAWRVLISLNPTAGSTPAEVEVQRLVELLKQRDFEAEILTNLDEVARRANQNHDEGTLRALVSVGGDGTVAELVNRTNAGVPITILPTGNENLLARYLGLRRSADALAETIDAGNMIRLDAGRAAGRLFLLMMSCGFDAEVVRRFEARRSGHAGSWSYARPILQTLAHYEYSKILIYCDEPNECRTPNEAAASEAGWVFVFNLPCYGGGLRFAPGADGTDGLLDVCTFRHGSTWHGLRYLAALLARQHGRLADCRRFRAGRMRIEANGKTPYQLDGDFAGYLPVEVDVVPGRVTCVVPTAER